MQVKFFDADMQEERIVSYDTYIHCHFMEITNDLLDQDETGQKLFEVLENAKKVDYNPYLDASSDGEQNSSLENEEMKGHSLRLFTPPQDEDTVKDHWEDYKLDNQHDSHVDNDYSYHRYISKFDIDTVANHQQLLVALGSLSSSVEQYMPHSADCVKCKKNKRQDLIELLADSGASLNFTHE